MSVYDLFNNKKFVYWLTHEILGHDESNTDSRMGGRDSVITEMEEDEDYD